MIALSISIMYLVRNQYNCLSTEAYNLNDDTENCGIVIIDLKNFWKWVAHKKGLVLRTLLQELLTVVHPCASFLVRTNL